MIEWTGKEGVQRPWLNTLPSGINGNMPAVQTTSAYSWGDKEMRNNCRRIGIWQTLPTEA